MMRHLFTILFAAVVLTSSGAQPSDMYNPELVLDSIINPKELKTLYDFDQWGNQTLHEVYEWSAEDNDWQGVYRIVSAFDQRGNETLYASYNWNEGTSRWEPSHKSESEYDDDNQLIHATMYAPDAAGDGWRPFANNFFAYDNAGNPTLYDYNKWSEETNDWQPESKYIYAYNEDNQVTLAEGWQWDDVTEQLVGLYKIVKEYSGVLNIFLSSQYAWDPESASWKLDIQDGDEWNDDHTCWTLTEYAVFDGEREAVRHILYYFNSNSSLSMPTVYDKYTNPFDEASADDSRVNGIYDISGRRISAERLKDAHSGVYIVNGKKVIKH